MQRRLSDSKHYNVASRTFQNLSVTPALEPGVSFLKVLRETWRRPRTVVPPVPLPVTETSLKELTSLATTPTPTSVAKPRLVWFGHSSYLIAYKGTTFLVDPVFSNHASPVAGLVKAFPYAYTHRPADLPPIDYLILTHNHYDHLDKKTVKSVKPLKNVILPLGVTPDFLSGRDKAEEQVIEMDWWEYKALSPKVKITAVPARHFSGRGFKRNGSLWTSFVLELDGYKLFLGGDSGYDSHFKEIGQRLGPFDLSILECGQYGRYWPFIHMMPEQTLQAAIDLQSKALLPVHWAKFALSIHPWNEPPERLLAASLKDARSPVIFTPQIGEPFLIDSASEYPSFRWWRELTEHVPG